MPTLPETLLGIYVSERNALPPRGGRMAVPAEVMPRGGLRQTLSAGLGGPGQLTVGPER
ncbi:MAG: hypothetical protein ACYTEX_28060 [Planctomycetota bacterium]